ncbi:MAG: glucosaminidase domain-containing protein [Prevotella sp.]|jgi:LysM repeat protein
MKKRIQLILLCLVVTVAHAQLRPNMAYQTYINQYKDLAIAQMMRYHIPASITLAQGLLESRAGLSELARTSNNHFGIKCHGWSGATAYADDDDTQECFRAYPTVYASYEDHSKFLAQQPRYRSLFRLSPTDYRGWARGLKKCGYATSPSYAKNLIDIIELYRLDRFDRAKDYDPFIVEHSSKVRTPNQGRLHPITIYNKNYYIIARPGDTWKSIGKEIGISWRKIAKYNERDKHDKIIPGEIIYLKKKRSKAEKRYKKYYHVVKAGESMYSISQLYGIRLKSLYSINRLSPDWQIYVGARLKVY